MLKWSSGLKDFKTHTLNGSEFTTTIHDREFEPNRHIDAIFLDHLKSCNGTVELLYSGGADSELVLASCLRNKIPIEAMTMVIKVKGAVLNTTDLYYSEKFCRQNNVKQNLFYLDATQFYNSGKYLDYLLPFNITEPHVASHFWMIEQCHNFPVMGGDWPWVQTHKDKKVLSPFRLAYNSYERYMKSKNIDGIGNMLSHSYESSYYFMNKHIEFSNKFSEPGAQLPFMKYVMYELNEPRVRSYGWEDCPRSIFNILDYKAVLLKKLGKPECKIVWEEQTKKLLNTDITENSLFI